MQQTYSVECDVDRFLNIIKLQQIHENIDRNCGNDIFAIEFEWKLFNGE